MSADEIIVIENGEYVYPPTFQSMQDCTKRMARSFFNEMVNEQTRIDEIIKTGGQLDHKHWKRTVYLSKRVNACVRILDALEEMDVTRS